MKKAVGRLAYELELPARMRIHPVILVAQLEPALVLKDPYNRPRNMLRQPIDVDSELLPLEYVNSILSKRTSDKKT